MGNATIDINAQLAAKGQPGWTHGSAVFQYHRKHPGALETELYLENSAASLSFTIPSIEKPVSSLAQYAVFWLPSRDAEVYVALQNTSGSQVTVSPNLAMQGLTVPLPRVQLPPYGSSVIELANDSVGALSTAWQKDAVGGITVIQDGPISAINTGGWIEEDRLGYSTTMTFQDPTVGHGVLLGTQILVGSADQVLNLVEPLVISSKLILRNIGDQELTFSGDLTFSKDGSLITAAIQKTPLATGEIKCIDLNLLKATAGVPESFVAASVVLRYSGKGGALMARVFGASEDRSYGFYWAMQPFADASYSESFWTTSGDWTPILTVANFGTASDRITVELTFNQGTFKLAPISLLPLESHTINIRDLLSSGTTDVDGKSFPTGVDFGGYKIYGASQQSKIVTKEHLIDPLSRLATPFYGGYVYETDFYFQPDSYADDIGGTTDVFTTVVYSDDSVVGGCPDGPYPYNIQPSGPATVTQDYCLGLVTGNQVGSATLYASETLVIDDYGDKDDVTTSNGAQISITPSIKWNGTDLTDPSVAGTNQNAVVGQQIFLNGNPAGGTWHVDDTRVAGFDVAPDNSYGRPETLIVTSDPDVLFYWVDSGTKGVSYTVNNISASVNFNVGAPTLSFSYGPTIGLPTVQYSPNQLILIGSNPSPGFQYVVSISPPSGIGASSTQTANIVISSNNVNHGLSGATITCTSSGLDTKYPAKSGNEYDDSPALGLDETRYSEESWSVSNDTYIMWNPLTSSSDIFVPLEHVTWGFNADAIWNGQSWILNGQPSTSGPGAAPTVTFPQWSTNVTGGSCTAS